MVLACVSVVRHDGLVIMATNRPFDLDEAMHRRITLSIEVMLHSGPPHASRRCYCWRCWCV